MCVGAEDDVTLGGGKAFDKGFGGAAKGRSRRELTRHHTVQKTGLAEQERARQELIDSQRKAN
jgi:hypothetical protein